MKKYLVEAGFTFKGDYNDMKTRQFYLSDVAYENSEQSVMGNMLLDRQETYVLFLANFNPFDFQTKMQGVINAANSDGMCTVDGNSISAERQENGHYITMSFIIKGK